ncbi:MAG: hypothetical protein GY737_17195, partial [Desulfobacteraceae bacterium]|nr:hypothetical protein [Desulfobacteraceae bacterium]
VKEGMKAASKSFGKATETVAATEKAQILSQSTLKERALQQRLPATTGKAAGATSPKKQSATAGTSPALSAESPRQKSPPARAPKRPKNPQLKVANSKKKVPATESQNATTTTGRKEIPKFPRPNYDCKQTTTALAKADANLDDFEIPPDLQPQSEIPPVLQKAENNGKQLGPTTRARDRSVRTDKKANFNKNYVKHLHTTIAGSRRIKHN